MKILQLGYMSIRQCINKYGDTTALEALNPGVDEFYLFSYRTVEGQRAKLANVRIHEFKYSPPVFHQLKVFFYLLAFAIRKKPDIIHAKDQEIIGPFAFLISRLTGVPYCISLHGGERPPNLIGRFVLKRADMVLPISRYLARYAESHGVSPDRIRVAYHGVDPLRFQNKPEYDSGGRRRVAFVGRLSPEKRVYEMLLVMFAICRQRSDVTFLIAGDGKERRTMEQLVKAHDYTDRILFLGFQTRWAVAELMQSSDVILCPYSGFVLIEAAMSGKPIVANDAEWHGELIEHEKNGLLLPFDSIDRPAAAIIRLLNDEKLSRRLGQTARGKAFKEFAVAVTDKTKIKYYYELINRGRKEV